MVHEDSTCMEGSFICTIFCGVRWVNCSTQRAASHVAALRTMESLKSSLGRSRSKEGTQPPAKACRDVEKEG